jgi:hypothetical protein
MGEGDLVTIARGPKTYQARSFLGLAGFRWNPKKKWWVCDPALHDADRFALVKTLRQQDLADGVEVKSIERRWLDADADD